MLPTSHRARHVAGAVAALALVAGCSAAAGATADDAGTQAAYHGQQPLVEPARPSFTLVDTSGKPYDFAQQTRGRATFVYFGYTHCPDECPTAMADLASALRKATPAQRAAVDVVFVTTDPARDTGPVIRQWLDQFSTSFVGLTGSEAALTKAITDSGLSAGVKAGPVPTVPGHPDEHYEKPGTAPHKHFGAIGYGVNHADLILAYDTHDRLPVTYPGGVTPSDIAADLPLLLGA